MKKQINSHSTKVASGLTSSQAIEFVQARRTAFVARFIVLREAKRSRAHRVIEAMEWDEKTTAEVLYDRFREAFINNGDNMMPVDRDLRRALAHANPSLRHFIEEYASRATTSFIGSLYDYEKSNELLFKDGENPRLGGWRMPDQLEKE